MLSRFRLELIFAALVFVLGAIAVHGAADLDTGWAEGGPQAGFFPLRVGIVLMVAALAVGADAWRKRAELRFEISITPEGGRRVLAIGLPIIALVAVSQWLGMYVASALYLAGVIHWGGGRSWAVSAAIALGFTVATFVAFEQWFLVPLLKGPLEVWLGLA